MSEQTKGYVFITGAAAGIGHATVLQLRRRGYSVLAAVHEDRGSLDELGDVTVVPLDIADSASVAAAAAQVSREVGPAGLRAVVNNAGVIVQGPLELVPTDDLKRQFDVNVLGPAYLTQALLPLLRAGQGRVINISAPTARVPVPFMAPISASKAALASLSDALRGELAAWRIPVVVIEPGATDTSIFAKADAAAQVGFATADASRVGLYRSQLAAVAKAAAKQKPGPAEDIARVIVKALEARRPRRRYAAGPGSRVIGALSHLPAALRDRVVIRAFGLASVQAEA